jgi:probable DNA metabolism protein
MTIFTCAPGWEAMLTCIYEASESKLGYKSIRLLLEPLGQQSFLDEYIHVEPDEVKAEKVATSIIRGISYHFYQELAYTAMAYEEDVLDNIYHVLLLGFRFGENALKMVQYRDIIRNREIRARVVREAERFREILRFHQLGNLYVAHFEPKSRVASYLGPIFQDRMPSENFMIVDDVHREAVVHRKNEPYYMWQINDREFARLAQTEEENDEYTDLWKAFFDSIAIKERANEKCQMSHFPLWARKHAVEFTIDERG